MQVNFVIAVCIFTSTLVNASPGAEDERWENCDDVIDSGLAHLGVALNSSESFRNDGIGNCKESYVRGYGTIKRVADIPFFATDIPGTFLQKMKLGFSLLQFDVSCVADIGTEKVSGIVHVDWREPRFSFDVLTNKKYKTFAVTNTIFDSGRKGLEVFCEGDEKWNAACKKLVKDDDLYKALEHGVERLFPGEAKELKKRDDKDVMMKLMCDDSLYEGELEIVHL